MPTPLYLDIETIPDIDIDVCASTIEITAPGNYKNQESIDKYVSEKRKSIHADLVKEASLNPVYGRIVSVAIRYKGETYVHSNDIERSVIGYVGTFLEANLISWETTRLITFNGKAFDVPFLNIRAGYELLPNVSKYDQKFHLDILLYLNNFGAFRAPNLSMSQKAIAEKLGLPPVSGHGSEIYNLYKAGDFESIRKHNMDDVEQLELICKKLGIVGERMPF